MAGDKYRMITVIKWIMLVMGVSLLQHDPAFAQVNSEVHPNPLPYYYLGTQLIPDSDTASPLLNHSPNSLVNTCTNSNFSAGDFTGWTGCFGGFATPCDNTGFSNTRHVIMPRANQLYDPFIGSPLTTVFPGDEHSARLGDTLEGNHSEQLRYTVTVTPDHFLFIYRWASVLESVGHLPSQMPKFALQVEDMNGNAIGGSCGFYEFIAPNCSPPGPSCIVPPEWHYVHVTSPSIDLYWHDWTTIALDLSPYLSQGTVQIVFTTRGCSLQIHRGYAYLSTYCTPLANQISMCANSAHATLTAPPGFATYEWRGPGLSGPVIGNTQSIIIDNPQPGDMFYVNLTAANGCMVNDLNQEIIATVVSAEFSAVPHCPGEATSFQDMSTINQNDVVYWHWMFGDGQPDLGGTPTPTHVYSAPGTYTVTLHAYSTDGCMGAVSHEVTISAIPSPTLTGPETACENGAGQTYTTEAGMTGYNWSFPPGTTVISGGTSTDHTATISWVTSGNYTIGVNYSNPLGTCTSAVPASLNINVGTLAPPVISGNTSVCLGATNQVYSTQPGKINYLWSIPAQAQVTAGGTPSDHFVEVIWVDAGNYLITVNYSDPISLCTSVQPASINVMVEGYPGLAGPISGLNSVCRNSTANYSVSPIPNAVAYQWQYSGSGILIANNGTGSIEVIFTENAMSGILSVRGENSCGTGGNSLLSIQVHENPVVAFTPCFDTITTTQARKIILRGGSPFIQGQGSYSGSRVSLNPVTGQYEFDPAGAVPGKYTIHFSYTNIFGCTASSTPSGIRVVNSPFTCTEELTDVRDGKKYKTVLLSGHCWMQENLDYGLKLTFPNVIQTDNCLPEKYCSPSDANCTSYGGLYTWDELMDYSAEASSKGMCPPGWHIPSEVEWQTLINGLVAGTPLAHTSSTLGSKLKDLWLVNGFHAMTKGLAYNSHYWGFFTGLLTGTMFWTSSECSPSQGIARGVNLLNPSISWYCNSRGNAFSLRCVKD